MDNIDFTTIKAIAFDRDGTLNDMALPNGESLYYVLKPSELKLFDDVPPALAQLRQAGILPYVFTQQNGIGKGLLTEDGLADIHAECQRHLGEEARIEAYYHAPTNDAPDGKPHPGMLHKIMKAANCAPHELLAVGDSLRDYECAQNAGVPFIFLRTPKTGEVWPDNVPVFENLTGFIEHIKKMKISPKERQL